MRKRILLLGRDPNFAWAVQKKLASIGWYLEHVYTVQEAKTRLNRFRYDACLLDGISPEESRMLELDPNTMELFILEDVKENSERFPSSPIHHVSKEEALPFILLTLQNRLKCSG